MNDVLFSPRELVMFEAVYRQHAQATGKAVSTLCITVFLALLLAIVVITEYALFYEIFDFLKGSPVPGVEAHWSVGLLALTGCLMLLGFHLRASENPDAFAVRFVRRCVDIFLPVYALGAGLAVASIIFFDGADAVFSSATDSRELFSEPQAEGGASLIDWVMATFPVTFSLGCGGLVVINMFIGHRLVSMIVRNVGEITEAGAAAREAHTAMKTIQTCLQRFSEVREEQKMLLETDHAAEEIVMANLALRTISHELRPFQQWMIQQATKAEEPEKRFIASHAGLDLKEMNKRVAALQAINLKFVLAAIRVNTKGA